MRAISSWAKSITPLGAGTGHPRPPSAGAGGTAQAHQRPAGGGAAPHRSSVTTSTSFAVWRARRHSGISTALIHSSCSSTMIFVLAGAAAARRWTMPMPALFRLFASGLRLHGGSSECGPRPLCRLSPPRRPGAGASPSTSWKSCVQFMPTASCSPASTRKS